MSEVSILFFSFLQATSGFSSSAGLESTGAFKVLLAVGSPLRGGQPKSPTAVSEVKGAAAEPWPDTPRSCRSRCARNGERPASLRTAVLYEEEKAVQGQRGRNRADFKQGMSRRSSGSASGPVGCCSAKGSCCR